MNIQRWLPSEKSPDCPIRILLVREVGNVGRNRSLVDHRPLELSGGTTFHFISEEPSRALDIAKEAAGGRDIRLGGGPTTVRSFLKENLVDLLHVVQVPILLGRGVRLWDGLEGVESAFECETVASPSGVVHFNFARR